MELSQFYTNDNNERYKIYKSSPNFFARAPGRVNLIGEHIDYMGYGVLPFAIEKDCLIAVGLDKNSDSLEIHHVDVENYPTQVLSLDKSIRPEFKNNYIKYIWAGYLAALETLQAQKLEFGLKFVVSGNVPLSSGLSSSSSLVVCAGIATIRSLDGKPNQTQFVDNLIKYERLAGTACGGMDQSISVMGKLGQALYIQFNPIRAQEVSLPQGYAFVIANSLTPSAKLETLGTRYNKRVCECRVALYYLCRSLNVDPNGITTLLQLQEVINVPIDIMSIIVQKYIEPREYTFSEIENTLQKQLKEILNDIPQVETVFINNNSFNLRDRALHVFQESARVIKFKEICESNLPSNVKADLLGNLMNQSQQSCSKLYQCSSQQIEQLTQLCLKYGALGSRLTGAGWGGCTVSLIKENQAAEFVSNIKKEFFEAHGYVSDDEVIFVTKPSIGASTLEYLQVFNEIQK